MSALPTPTGALRELHDLPGPRALPLIGNAWRLQRTRVHQQVEAWSREYGPYFRFRLGRRGAMLGVSDHEALAALLRDRPDGFRRTRLLEQVGREMGLNPGLFAANGDDWKRQRRMVMAGLDPSHVKAYYPSLAKVALRLRGRWQRAADAGAAIELQPDLMRFTVDAIAGLAFGADVNTLESDAEVIQQHLDKIFPMLSRRLFAFVPWWRFMTTPADRRVARSVTAVNEAIGGFILAARGRLAADPARRTAPPNLLEAMVVAAEDGQGRLSDTEVAGNVLTMLLAGEDTTANTLAWMIHLLWRHPAALQRAEAEVRGLRLDLADFTPEHLAGLDYLEACAHETMRLKPVAPFQVMEALQDTRIGDVRVPAGTLVWCVMRGDTLAPAHFPSPDAFRPERWLGGGGDGADGAAGLQSAKRISMPFGAGPRVCPGRYLALLEIKMAMVTLLNHFQIESVDTPDGAEPVEHLAFTMMPVGLRMRLRPGA